LVVVSPCIHSWTALNEFSRSVLIADTLGRLIIPQNVKFIYNNFKRIISLLGELVVE